MSGNGMGESGMSSPVSEDGTGMGPEKGNSSMGGMMKMYFHAGVTEYILFQQFHIDTAAGLAWACFVVFVVSFLYEIMKYGREELLRHQTNDVTVTSNSQNNAGSRGQGEEQSLLNRPRLKLWSGGHLLQTCLHFVQLWISYSLMLVFMTYNVFLCLSLVLGATVAYFLTAWKRQNNDNNNSSMKDGADGSQRRVGHHSYTQECH